MTNPKRGNSPSGPDFTYPTNEETLYLLLSGNDLSRIRELTATLRRTADEIEDLLPNSSTALVKGPDHPARG